MKFFLLLFLTTYTPFVFSFDKIRNHQFLSLGMGVNFLDSTFTLEDESSQSFTDAGASLQLRFGSNVTKKVALFSSINQQMFFGQAEQGGYFLTDIGVGAQYYFTKYVRSPYLLGSAATTISKFEGEGISFGRTFEIGVGYEMFQNWQFEISVRDTNSKVNHTLFEQLGSQSAQFSINYIWY